jgi:hypothetical protein
MKIFKLYIKCLYWNKVLLAGWIIIIVGIFLVSIPIASIGSALIGVTKFGIDTIDTYRRTLAILKRYGETTIKPSMYCNIVGYNWALKEYQKLKIIEHDN